MKPRIKLLSLLCTAALLVTMASVIALPAPVAAETYTQSFEDAEPTLFANSGSTTISTDVAHSGSRSLKFSLTKYCNNKNTNKAMYADATGTPIPLTVGKTYVLSAWVYYVDSFNSKVRLITTTDTDLATVATTNNCKGYDINSSTGSVMNTGEWIRVTYQFTAALSSKDTDTSVTTTYATMGVSITDSSVSGVNYTVYMDDVYIEEYAPVAGVQSFEDGEPTYTVATTGSTAVSSEQAHTGLNSLKLNIVEYANNGNTNKAVYEDSDGTPVPLTVGKTYTLSAWVYFEDSFNSKVRLITTADLSRMSNYKYCVGYDILSGTQETGKWIHVTQRFTASLRSDSDDLTATTTYASFGVSIATSGETGDYTVYVDDVYIEEAAAFQAEMPSLLLSGTDTVSVGLQLPYTLSKTDPLYADATEEVSFGLLHTVADTAPDILNKDTAGVTDTACTYTEGEDTLTIAPRITAIAATALDKLVIVRPYIRVGDRYIYGDMTTYCPATLANGSYPSADQTVQARLRSAFASSTLFDSEVPESLTFVAFSDYHYNAPKTATGLQDLRAVLKRADDENAAFVMSMGDMFQNYGAVPELFPAFLENDYDLPVYNIYGNHELESAGTTMALVTPTLTNDENVVWGTADGKMDETTEIAYYYFDSGSFRMICLDNNFYTDADGVWHHNSSASYGPPSDAVLKSTLGDVQTAWLEGVLEDAIDQGKQCLIMAHAHMYNNNNDYPQVRKVLEDANAKKANTVLAVFCGHTHMDKQMMINGILYKNVNVVRGCLSDDVAKETGVKPYQGLTYEYEEYDDDGNYVDTYDRLYTDTDFWQSMYSTEAMSSLVTVYTDGTIVIDGIESAWLNDELPLCTILDGEGPRHSSLVVSDGTLTVGSTHTHVVGDTEAYASDAGSHWLACAICEEAVGTVNGHDYADGTCDVCGATAAVDATMTAITSVYQYVGGGTDNSTLQAEAGSAVYTHADGSLRTAFRVPASYVTDSADFSTIVLDGVSYPLLERGIILGTEGQTLTVDSPLKSSVTSGFKDKYWKYDSETGTVTYTALVKNVSRAMLSTNYIARSYVKISVGGTEQIVYSDTCTAFTPQSLYDKAAAQLVAEGKPAPKWFYNDKTDDGVVDLT